jgi:hypothetical protein
LSEISGRRLSLVPSTVQTIFAWFQRIVGVYCMIFGVLYWVRLVGIYDGPLWRFDLMPVYWQIAAVTLAGFFPLAGIGLWALASWGPVIWFICAAGETIMYAGFPELFGSRTLVLFSHLAVALLYTVLRVLIAREKRRAAEQG